MWVETSEPPCYYAFVMLIIGLATTRRVQCDCYANSWAENAHNVVTNADPYTMQMLQ